MRWFYDPHITADTQTHFLSEEESKHACKVLRLKEGDTLALVNGKGTLLTAQITSANPKKCSVKIIASHTEVEPNYTVHIAIAPTKMNERMEWFVEKSTELGITDITFILCKNAERKVIKNERFESIAIAAMKQSRRLYLPRVQGLVKLEDFLSTHNNGLIAECYEGHKTTISESFQKKDCPILIGPEGDFTIEEVAFAQKNGYSSVSLGTNRLRTETAGLYACMQALMNRL